MNAIVVTVLLFAAGVAAFLYRANPKKESDRAYNVEQNFKTLHEEQLSEQKYAQTSCRGTRRRITRAA